MKKTVLQKEEKKERILLLDILRGIGILFVIWYHLMFDLWEFYRMCSFISSGWMDVIRDILVGMLVLISGVCCHFSRSNIKRGAICFLIAMGLTVVTRLFGAYSCVKFGILHMFGVSMLLYGLLERRIYLKRPWMGAVICFVGFLLTFMVSYGGFGIYRWEICSLPEVWYCSEYWFWLGFPSSGFFSADYYPLFPWTFLFFCGGYLGRYAHHLPHRKPNRWIKPLVWIGSHTMFLYLIHQPLFYGVLFLLNG